MKNAIVIVVGLFFAANASALAISGDVYMVHAPASVKKDARTNNNKALLFAEQKNATLLRSLDVEAFLPGVYDPSSSNIAGRTLAKGRVITSYMLHADIDPGSITPELHRGSIYFDSKILGVIFGDFSDSDSLVGAPSLRYETVAGHGLDLNDPFGDAFRISNNRMRFEFNFNTFDITDQVRIIVTGKEKKNPVPEPITPTLLAMGLGALVMRRRHVA